MYFKDLALFLEDIEKESSRNKISTQLAEFMQKVPSDSINITTYMLMGKIAPEFQMIEFNFSEKQIEKSLTELLNEQQNKEILNINLNIEIKSLKRELGDQGKISEYVRKQINILPSKLTVLEVHKLLTEISEISGKGSQEERSKIFKQIFLSLDPISCKFLVRIILGNMRMGFSEKTFLDALSILLSGSKELRKELDLRFGYCSDIGIFTQKILEERSSKSITNILSEIKITPLIPLASKLVERESSVQNVWNRMPKCFVQPKLDGLRGQIHLLNQKVRIFSRNMEDMTHQYPEIVEGILNLGVSSIILDSEIIGFNQKTEEFLSYQETMKRKRKYDIESHSRNIPVVAMCFDILFLDGEDVSQKPLEFRINLLEKIIGGKNLPTIKLLETKQMHSEEELSIYFEEKLRSGLEGIITKESNTTYEPGTRNFKWIKLKANTKDELVDTIDVVVMGYYFGKGNRNKFGFGALLVGSFDPETSSYTSIGKVGSGFTEENMNLIFKDLQEFRIDTKPDNYLVDKSLYPDIWIEPKIIVEIIADEITRSPIHLTGKGMSCGLENDDYSKGLSIRFPRLKNWRKDKKLPNTVEEILRMYYLRKTSKTNKL